MTTQVHDSMLVTGPDKGSPVQNTPIAGATVALTPTQPTQDVLLLHASTLATLTITIANGQIDGQSVSIFFKSAVTTCTWSGANLLGTVALPLPGNPTAGQRVTYIWAVANPGWIRVA